MKSLLEFINEQLVSIKNYDFKSSFVPDFVDVIKYEPHILNRGTKLKVISVEINKQNTDYRSGILCLDVELETGKGYGVHNFDETMTFELLKNGLYKRDSWAYIMKSRYSDTERICMNIINAIEEFNTDPEAEKIIYAHMPKQIIFNIHQELD